MDFYNDPLKVDEYEKMCKEYDGSELYKVLANNLKKNSTLLELGCGPGNDIVNLRKRYDVTGSDLSDEFLTRCKKRFQELSFIKLDAVSIDTEINFDSIFSNKVLHHLPIDKLTESLKRQQKILKPGGIFAHTFWLGDKELIMDGMLFLFHNRDRLIQLVSQYFKIIETYDYKEFEEGDSIFVIARNNKLT